MAKNKDKVMGALLGVAIGDALGAPLEFMTADQIRDTHGGPVRDMIGGGWLNVAPGEITDDTQMTLAVAEGIAANPRDPIPEIGRRFIDWYDSGPKDIGNCCRAAIAYAKADGAKDFRRWLDAAQRVHEDTGGQTAGNGALMRTIYPALWYGPGEATFIAGQIAMMTHIHDHSRSAVIAYTRAVLDLIHSHDGAIEWGKEQINRNVKPVRELTSKATLQPDGYAPNGLILAVDAINATNSFEAALIQAVNLGGDADTIGAITGGLAGALYGAEAIPTRWANKLDTGIAKQIGKLAKYAAKQA